MAVRSKEEILEQVRSLLNENTSDEALALIEDIDDTVSDYETRTKDSTNWKEKYEANDATWRKKYHDRFFNSSSDVDEPDPTNDPSQEPEKKYTYEELFKKE